MPYEDIDPKKFYEIWDAEGYRWIFDEGRWRKTLYQRGQEMFNTGHENLPLKLEDAVSWRELWQRIKRRIGKWLEGRVL